MSRGFNSSRTVMPFSEPSPDAEAEIGVGQPGAWVVKPFVALMDGVQEDPPDDAPTQPGDWSLKP